MFMSQDFERIQELAERLNKLLLESDEYRSYTAEMEKIYSDSSLRDSYFKLVSEGEKIDAQGGGEDKDESSVPETIKRYVSTQKEFAVLVQNALDTIRENIR